VQDSIGEWVKRRIRAFEFALSGMRFFIFSGPHAVFHSFAAVAVFALAFYFDVSKFEWLVLLLCVSAVLVAEILNTAIENVVDLASPEFHPLAKQAKDLAAFAVLTASLFSLLIGIVIFGPRIYHWL
jgi:diacylglycerol kinase